ncbi:hypothetical protein KA078_00935 [Candidatus Woesebacteria bacterium]|nr:hypothetical protein [Candidatus Woesebacteria bacterium]
MIDKQAGSFPAGFALGLLAGAAGYFAAQSPEAQKLKDFLQQEWEKARIELEQNGLKKTDARLMTQVIEELAEYVIAPFQDSVHSPATSAKKTINSNKIKRTTNQFRGV